MVVVVWTLAFESIGISC